MRILYALSKSCSTRQYPCGDNPLLKAWKIHHLIRVVTRLGLTGSTPLARLAYRQADRRGRAGGEFRQFLNGRQLALLFVVIVVASAAAAAAAAAASIAAATAAGTAAITVVVAVDIHLRLGPRSMLWTGREVYESDLANGSFLDRRTRQRLGLTVRVLPLVRTSRASAGHRGAATRTRGHALHRLAATAGEAHAVRRAITALHTARL